MPLDARGRAGRLNNRSVRDHNLSLVLREIAWRGRCSRSMVRSATGLTPGAVTMLVNDLIDAGLIRECGTMEAEGGRRKKQLALAGGDHAVAVIELGLDSVRVVAENLAGTPLVDEIYEEDFRGRSAEEFSRFCADRIDEVAQAVSGLRGVGIVVCAPVLAGHQAILSALDYGWGRVDLAAMIGAHRSSAPCPVVLLNDANCAAWAEYRHLHDTSQERFAGDLTNVFYIKTGVGIGSAGILAGRIMNGPLGTAMEVGHTQVDPMGEFCACGKQGCLATIADPEVIVRDSGLIDFELEHGRRATEVELRRLWEAGDQRVRAVFERSTRYTRIAIDNVLTLLAPDCVILGGYLAYFADALLAVPNGQTTLGAETPIIPGALGFDAARIGGMLRMRGAILDHAGEIMRGEDVPAQGLLCDTL